MSKERNSELEAHEWLRDQLFAEVKQSGDFQPILDYIAPPTDELERDEIFEWLFWQALGSNEWGLAELFLQNGFSLLPSGPELPDNSVLCNALEVLGDCPDVLSWLLDHGAPIERQTWGDDCSFESPLMVAARLGLTESMTLLLARGADPCKSTGIDEGWDALLEAAASGQEEAVKLLLPYYNSTPASEVRRRIAAGMARKRGHDQVAELILRAHSTDQR